MPLLMSETSDGQTGHQVAKYASRTGAPSCSERRWVSPLRSVRAVGGGGGQGARQVVGGGQQVLAELLNGVGARVIGLALGAAPRVLRLGRVAQHLFLQRLVLGGQGLDMVDRRIGDVIDGVGRRLIVGHVQSFTRSRTWDSTRAV